MNLAEVFREIDALRELVNQLRKRIEHLESENAALKAENATLRQRLELNSQTSSLPPSSDGPKKPPPRSRTPSTRKPGGQPKHPGSTLRQIDAPDRTVELVPQTCQRCHTQLDPQRQTGQPERRQVFDLPEDLRLQVTEFLRLTLVCPCCQAHNRADFPPQVVGPAQYGSAIKALAAWMHHGHGLPYERAAELLGQLFHCSIGAATLVNTTGELARALEPVVAQLQSQLLQAPVAHADETGLRVAGRNWWVHTFCTTEGAVLSLSPHRGRLAMAHLKDYKGVLVHDCNRSYFNFGTYDNALCNAHILRELQFCYQVRGHGWALELQTVLRDLYRQAREARSAGLSALNPQVIESSQARILELIAQARANLPPPPPPPPSKPGRKPQSKELNLLDRLERWFDALLRFATDLTVPFDNNLAERSIRMLKVLQKIFGCWRTIKGATDHLIIRSCLLMLKAKGLSVLSYLEQAHRHRSFATPTG